MGDEVPVNLGDATPRRLLVDWANGQDGWIRQLTAETILSRQPPSEGLVDAIYDPFIAEKGLSSSAPADIPQLELAPVKRGGRTVLIGISAPDATARLSLDAVLGGREIVSMLNGGARPDRDDPRLIADIRSGRINVRDQVSAVWPIDRIEEAIAALKAGEVTRAVLDHDR